MPRLRLSAAYETLNRYGLDARAMNDVTELLQAFAPIKQYFKNEPDGRAELYTFEIRPALLVIRSHIERVHLKAFGRDASKLNIRAL